MRLWAFVHCLCNVCSEFVQAIWGEKSCYCGIVQGVQSKRTVHTCVRVSACACTYACASMRNLRTMHTLHFLVFYLKNNGLKECKVCTESTQTLQNF